METGADIKKIKLPRMADQALAYWVSEYEMESWSRSMERLYYLMDFKKKWEDFVKDQEVRKIAGLRSFINLWGSVIHPGFRPNRDVIFGYE